MNYLTVKQTAEMLQYHPNTIYRWLHQGLMFYRINRKRIRIAQKDLEEWVGRYKEKMNAKEADI